MASQQNVFKSYNGVSVAGYNDIVMHFDRDVFLCEKSSEAIIVRFIEKVSSDIALILQPEILAKFDVPKIFDQIELEVKNKIQQMVNEHLETELKKRIASL